MAGGTITKTGTISLAAGGVTNADLAHDSLTVNAGADLTGGGAVLLGGSTTLNLDTTKVPLLASANSFTNSQSITGNLAVSGTVSGGTGTFSGNVSGANLSTGGGVSATYVDTTGVNLFSPGFSEFVGSEPEYVVDVTNSGGGNGIIAFNNASSGTFAGVYAAATSSINANGVFGQQGGESSTASNFASAFSGTNGAAGVWGDGGTTTAEIGVIGTVDSGWAGLFTNSGSGTYTLEAVAQNSAEYPFYAANSANGTSCNVDTGGNLNCTGSKNAIVPIDGGARIVAMSAIEAPQNWFEDAGSAELVKGVAVVTLDHDFTQTVNTEMDYNVFPVPNGDCKGLYVTNKTATSFEVRELGGGTSSVRFDYRIMALRRKYENVRFADHSHDLDQMKLGQNRLGMKVAPHSHKPDMSRQPRPASTKAMLTPTATKSPTR